MEEVPDIEELRLYLVKRIEELEEELARLKKYLNALENMISEKTFVPANQMAREAAEPEPKPRQEAVERRVEHVIRREEPKPIRKDVLYIYRGRPIAWVEHYEKGFAVSIDKEFGLRKSHSLIKRFLEPRLREEMAKDMQEIERGERRPEDRFTFHIVSEGDVITRIEVRDNGEIHRRKDTIGKIRWVLKKFDEEKARELAGT